MKHIKDILQDLPCVRMAAWVDGGSPNKQLGVRQKRGSQKVAPFLKNRHGGALNKTPNWVIKTNCVMKVSKQGDLFGEVEIILESPNLDKTVKGIGFDFYQAVEHFEKAVVQEMRTTLKKLLSVYKHSKYQFEPIKGKEVLEILEKATKRINRRTRLKKAKNVIGAIYEHLEFILPRPEARTFPSQIKKVDLLGEFIDFDFSNWTLN